MGSDIAIGISRLIGFHLTLNFNLPYFATSLRDFWRRWHISLSTWLRDYLYVPLGGSRSTTARTCLNLGITMLLGGLWHGASVTFVFWGAWHGLGLILNHLWRRFRPASIVIPFWLGWLLTQAFVLYGWLLFRAGSLHQVIQFTAALGNFSLPSWWTIYLRDLLGLASPLVLIELWQWRSRDLDVPMRLSTWPRAALLAALLVTIVAFWRQDATSFIYFQF